MFVEESDLERTFQLPPTTYIGGDQPTLPLRDIIGRLEVIIKHIVTTELLIHKVLSTFVICSFYAYLSLLINYRTRFSTSSL